MKYDDDKRIVITLDAGLEQSIMDSVKQTEYGAYLNLDPHSVQEIYNCLSKEIQKFTNIGEQPMVLASPVVRIYFKKLTEQVAPGLTVLSYNELDPSVEVQSIGVVRI